MCPYERDITIIFSGKAKTARSFVIFNLNCSKPESNAIESIGSFFLIAVSRTIFKRIHKSQKENVSSAWFYSILIGFATFVIFGLWTLGLFFLVWTVASTLYVKKDNPEIKIISRYVNQGAFGGGTEPDDYQIVLHRPILFIFKMETSMDTAKFDRTDWVKSQN